MLKYINLKNVLSLCMMVLPVLFSGCDEEDADTTVVLDSFGPSVLRGGELTFVGQNLNKVTAIVLPENVEIPASSFDTQTATKIVLVVPDEAVEGHVILKTPSGDITSKSQLSILEPITLAALPTTAVRPGEIIVFTGTYLNLIGEVVFADAKSVTEFEAQSRESLSVRIPLDARTGRISLFDSGVERNELKSETDLQITLPSITNIAPSTVKAGTNITITGADLDLVVSIELSGNQTVGADDFVSQSATQIVVQTPADTDDGIIRLVAPSLVKVTSTTSLTMSLPTIASVTPNPAKTGEEVTVTGTDLDLVSSVTFEGDKTGTVKSGGSSTSIVIEIPADAKSGAIVLGTRANKSVSSTAVEMIKPAITSITPEAKLNEDVTIIGTNLDIVKTVVFEGNTTGVIVSQSETELVVTVPLGTLTGEVTLIADNNDEVVSADDLTILADVPEFDAFPSLIKPGALMTLTGEKINLTNEVIFPGNVKATRFGDRTSTLLEVYVPEDVTPGVGKITFTTYGTDITESANINFSWADPVVDPSLVYFNFNGKNSWWGSAVYENVAANSLDGTTYAKVVGSFSGWTDLFNRNSQNDLPVATIGTNVAAYNFKVDIYVRSPIEAGNLKFRLGEHWYNYGPAAPNPQNPQAVSVTPGWVTLTIPLENFRDNYGWGNQLANMADVGAGAFGLAWDNGSEDVDVLIDNVRFELK